MIRHAKASSARSNPRESSSQGSSRPSDRLRLTILLAAIAAFLLVPAAQALAASTATVNVAGTGSGTVTGGYEFYNEEAEEEVTAFTGTPPINCSGPPKTGSCTASITATNPFEEFLLEYFESEGGGGIGLSHPAAPGSAFAGWTIVGGTPKTGCETSEPHCLIVTAEGENVEVTATFECEIEGGCQPELDVTVKGKGKVDADSGPISGCRESSGTCSGEYPEGEEVTLTATPDPGNELVGWTGCDSEPGGNCEVTMDKAKSVEAEFAPTPEYALTVNKAGSGSGTVTCNGGACAVKYPKGTKVTLAATAASGSSFSGFSGGGCSGTGSCVVTMSADTTVTATFTTEEQLVEKGTAKAAPSASVRSGKAALKLSCSGGPCQGTLKLTAKVKQGHKAKNIVIGKASFSLAKDATKTIKVKLSSAAKNALAKAPKLKAKLTGTGIASSTVTLKAAKQGK